MEDKDNLAKNIIELRGIKPNSNERFQRFGLSFNPFPRAGISDLNSTDHLISKLTPVDKDIRKGIEEFIVDSLFPQNPESNDKYLSAIIRGDYGFGKTQTLLYAKLILESFSNVTEIDKKPYVVYIDNPGSRLSELIGNIISEIGEENFKRYLWTIAFDAISKNKVFKDEILKFKPSGYNLFDGGELDPFNPVNLVNYKVFFDAFNKVLNPVKKKEFQGKIKEFISKIFIDEFESPIIASYFYDLISENIGLNKTWEILTSGNSRDLDKKEVYIIRAIVKVIESQGYTDFYILVDEFEAVTAGRLNAKEIDQYVLNLRALIDKERNWCSLFAMTGYALSRLRTVSPPLAERISGRLIELNPLNDVSAKQITTNYLNLARESADNIFPFDESGVKELRAKSNGILRIYLKSCFNLLQRAVEDIKEGEFINAEFVDKHFIIEEE
ncbi:MAG: hypothetical protein JNM71_04895 [Flavobacterium lindanitolerans]|uniref:hypothetical protein n=1 Tax=Flavobacterium lindanitolerans TaxID=428988 RepID=UPI001A606353|nr:hypothetical protein [Flavobacterium lindanitolerans]MBL7867335.1 hypothetical protein [Flavobacterium lindanitolerans]